MSAELDPSPDPEPDTAGSSRPGSRMSRLTARGEEWAVAALTWARRTPGAALVVRIATDIARGNVTDRAMTLAGQAFTSLLPIVILLTTLPGKDVVDDALHGLGIKENAGIVAHSTPESFGAFGIFGALMTIAGATSLARALGRMYVSIWGVTKLPLRGWWRWVIVIFVIPVAATVQGLAAGLRSMSIFGVHIEDRGLLGFGLEIGVTLIVWSLLWTVIPRLLVSAQVPWRLLAINGIATGLCVTALLVGSRVALPRILESTTDHFGTLGVVFVAISWLFFFACILVVVTLVIHAIASDAGYLGRWVRRHAGVPVPAVREQSSRWYDQLPI
ncbi:hypothetical protein QSJ18_04685 [Gordonia sp. ABSL1-1]|uniref:YhjD/YihY/BrkB family envelope integrity protein n=1 Tax=Gordonia sp. ABSL1-1 TaxID=3053923 RepID=UPI00257443B3|nr:YhjD/YihY/BrkB family envelope integrity protein [Gordonia sp. ABSL1-1]MDL9936032.1 hypothetical protein [Gordonia sp. ABSL1-1]